MGHITSSEMSRNGTFDFTEIFDSFGSECLIVANKAPLIQSSSPANSEGCIRMIEIPLPPLLSVLGKLGQFRHRQMLCLTALIHGWHGLLLYRDD